MVIHVETNHTRGRRDDPERERAIERLDFKDLMRLCGAESAPVEGFENALRDAVRSYQSKPGRSAFLPANERRPAYAKLTKAIDTLHDQLTIVHEHVEWEIDMASMDFEPSGPDMPDMPDIICSGEYKGLSYGGYRLHELLERLEGFSEIVRAARDDNARKKGKPQQNGGLQQAIRNLGAVFEAYSGQPPMARYRYDEVDESQPYKGAFFDFLHKVIWTLNDGQKPSSHSIGDAARRAFQLRK